MAPIHYNPKTSLKQIARDNGIDYRTLFLQADSQTLLQRFSETRRKHPLSGTDMTLADAIELERTLLAPIASEADLFIELVNRNFGAESDYASEENAKELRRVIDELQRSGRLRTLTIEIGGVKQAVSMSLRHGNKMVALYAASNNDYNNLGKLLNVETIQEACRLRVDEISYMTGMQWKAQWQMKSEPCITMRKPPGPWPDAAA